MALPYYSLRSNPFLTIGLSILLLGCTSANPDQVTSPNPSPTAQLPSPALTSQVMTGQAQTLPISAEIEVAGQIIQLEVARTPEQQAIGLMFRTELPSNRGMLFTFDPPRPTQFWMRNTLIPLDMVFMRDGQVKAIASNATPCTTDVCPLYGTAISVNQVLELPAGRASELGLQVGDRVTIRSVQANANPSDLSNLR
jgi:uncharacterized protein